MSTLNTPFTDRDLDIWLANELNVMFIGYHGCGKTERVKAAFERAGKKWKYFSCPTLDPWTDLIGIPTVSKDPSNEYIDYIKPKEFALDQVECIFLDEFNRAKPKVKNACMELIQFKSINGVKFNNLKVIWVAINPEAKDEEAELKYDVEKLDPAIKDRFHLHITVPYEISEDYFAKKYGKQIAKGAKEWWSTLDGKTQLAVSPRRLDYAIDIYRRGIDIKFVLPFESNYQSFVTFMNGGTLADIIKNLYTKQDEKETKQYIDSCKNLLNVVNIIIDNYSYIEYFSKFIPKENFAAKINDSNNVVQFIITNYIDYSDVIHNAHKTNPAFKDKINALDLVKIKDTFDFSKLPFQKFVDFDKAKVLTPTTKHIEKLKDKAFVHEINGNTIDIIKELIHIDANQNMLLNSLDPVAIFEFLRYVIENGASLKLPYGTIRLLARICKLCIDCGTSINDRLNDSGPRFKIHILKNLIYFL